MHGGLYNVFTNKLKPHLYKSIRSQIQIIILANLERSDPWTG